jgi:hypothetical protein
MGVQSRAVTKDIIRFIQQAGSAARAKPLFANNWSRKQEPTAYCERLFSSY